MSGHDPFRAASAPGPAPSPPAAAEEALSPLQEAVAANRARLEASAVEARAQADRRRQLESVLDVQYADRIDDVPTGTISQVLRWVDAEPDRQQARARLARVVEDASPAPRSSLLTRLERRLRR